MASNTISLNLDVASNGKLEAVAKVAQDIASNMERASASAKSTAEYLSKTVSGGTFGSRGSRDAGLNRGTASGTDRGDARNFSRQAQGLGGLVHIYATFAANVFAATAAFQALSRAMDVERMFKAMQVGAAQTGVSLQSLAKDIQKITDYSISAQDAAKYTNMAASAGIAGDKFAQLAVIAKGASAALGRDMGDALDRLIRGTTKLEPELLDELGILTKASEAYKNYAIQMNISVDDMTSVQKSQAYLNAVIAEGTRKWEEQAKVASANPYTQLAAKVQEAGNKVLNTLNTVLGPLASMIAQYESVVLFGMAAIVAKLGQMAMPELTKWKERARQQVEDAKSLAEKLKNADIAEKTEHLRKTKTLLEDEIAINKVAQEELLAINAKAKRDALALAQKTINQGGIFKDKGGKTAQAVLQAENLDNLVAQEAVMSRLAQAQGRLNAEIATLRGISTPLTAEQAQRLATLEKESAVITGINNAMRQENQSADQLLATTSKIEALERKRLSTKAEIAAIQYSEDNKHGKDFANAQGSIAMLEAAANFKERNLSASSMKTMYTETVEAYMTKVGVLSDWSQKTVTGFSSSAKKLVGEAGIAILAGGRTLLATATTIGSKIVSAFFGPWGIALTMLLTFWEPLSQFFGLISSKSQENSAAIEKVDTSFQTWNDTLALSNKLLSTMPGGMDYVTAAAQRQSAELTSLDENLGNIIAGYEKLMLAREEASKGDWSGMKTRAANSMQEDLDAKLKAIAGRMASREYDAAIGEAIKKSGQLGTEYTKASQFIDEAVKSGSEAFKIKTLELVRLAEVGPKALADELAGVTKEIDQLFKDYDKNLDKSVLKRDYSKVEGPFRAIVEYLGESEDKVTRLNTKLQDQLAAGQGTAETNAKINIELRKQAEFASKLLENKNAEKMYGKETVELLRQMEAKYKDIAEAKRTVDSIGIGSDQGIENLKKNLAAIDGKVRKGASFNTYAQDKVADAENTASAYEDAISGFQEQISKAEGIANATIRKQALEMLDERLMQYDMQVQAHGKMLMQLLDQDEAYYKSQFSDSADKLSVAMNAVAVSRAGIEGAMAKAGSATASMHERLQNDIKKTTAETTKATGATDKLLKAMEDKKKANAEYLKGLELEATALQRQITSANDLVNVYNKLGVVASDVIGRRLEDEKKLIETQYKIAITKDGATAASKKEAALAREESLQRAVMKAALDTSETYINAISEQIKNTNKYNEALADTNSLLKETGQLSEVSEYASARAIQLGTKNLVAMTSAYQQRNAAAIQLASMKPDSVGYKEAQQSLAFSEANVKLVERNYELAKKALAQSVIQKLVEQETAIIIDNRQKQLELTYDSTIKTFDVTKLQLDADKALEASVVARQMSLTQELRLKGQIYEQGDQTIVTEEATRAIQLAKVDLYQKELETRRKIHEISIRDVNLGNVNVGQKIADDMAFKIEAMKKTLPTFIGSVTDAVFKSIDAGVDLIFAKLKAGSQVSISELFKSMSTTFRDTIYDYLASQVKAKMKEVVAGIFKDIFGKGEETPQEKAAARIEAAWANGAELQAKIVDAHITGMANVLDGFLKTFDDLLTKLKINADQGLSQGKKRLASVMPDNTKLEENTGETTTAVVEGAKATVGLLSTIASNGAVSNQILSVTAQSNKDVQSILSKGGDLSKLLSDPIGFANALANSGNNAYAAGFQKFAESSLGNTLGLSDKIIANPELGTAAEYLPGQYAMNSTGSAVSSALPYLPAIMSALKGDVKGAIFTAIGTYLGGPVGGFVGSLVGSLFGGNDENSKYTAGFYMGKNKQGYTPEDNKAITKGPFGTMIFEDQTTMYGSGSDLKEKVLDPLSKFDQGLVAAFKLRGDQITAITNELEMGDISRSNGGPGTGKQFLGSEIIRHIKAVMNVSSTKFAKKIVDGVIIPTFEDYYASLPDTITTDEWGMQVSTKVNRQMAQADYTAKYGANSTQGSYSSIYNKIADQYTSKNGTNSSDLQAFTDKLVSFFTKWEDYTGILMAQGLDTSKTVSVGTKNDVTIVDQNVTEWLKSVGLESADLIDQLGTLADTFIATGGYAAVMGQDITTAFGAVGTAGLKARQGLITASGGLEKFTTNLQYYIQNFATSSKEIFNMLTFNGQASTIAASYSGIVGQISAAVGANNDWANSIPVTVEGYKQLMTSLTDLNDPTGELRGKLLALAPAIKGFAEQADQVSKAAIGLNGADLAGLMTDYIFNKDKLAAQGKDFGTTLEATIKKNLFSGIISNVAAMIIQGIVTPMLAGGATALAVSQATVKQIGGMVEAFGQVMKDPAFKTFLSELSGTISGIVGNMSIVSDSYITNTTTAEGTAAATDKVTEAINTLSSAFSSQANIVNELQSVYERMQQEAAQVIQERDKLMFDYGIYTVTQYTATLKETQATALSELQSAAKAVQMSGGDPKSYDLLLTKGQQYRKITMDILNLQLEQAKKQFDFVKSISEYLVSLSLSDKSILSPAQKLAEAEKAYNSYLEVVTDTTGKYSEQQKSNAQGKLTSSADQYLQIAQTYYASTSSYQAIFSKIKTDLEALGATSDPVELAKMQYTVSEGIKDKLGEMYLLDTQYADYIKNEILPDIKGKIGDAVSLLKDIGTNLQKLSQVDFATQFASLPAGIAAELRKLGMTPATTAIDPTTGINKASTSSNTLAGNIQSFKSGSISGEQLIKAVGGGKYTLKQVMQEAVNQGIAGANYSADYAGKLVNAVGGIDSFKQDDTNIDYVKQKLAEAFNAMYPTKGGPISSNWTSILSSYYGMIHSSTLSSAELVKGMQLAVDSFKSTRPDITEANKWGNIDNYAVYEIFKSAGLLGQLPKFATGTNFVPEDMYAQIHKGERIIPAADNEAIMAALNSDNGDKELIAEVAKLREAVAKLQESNEQSLQKLASVTIQSNRENADIIVSGTQQVSNDEALRRKAEAQVSKLT